MGRLWEPPPAYQSQHCISRPLALLLDPWDRVQAPSLFYRVLRRGSQCGTKSTLAPRAQKQKGQWSTAG